MLSKDFRLTKKKDFEMVFKKGEGVKGGFLALKVFKNSAGKIRFGFVISKKVSNKAVVRNKVRRRLKAAVFGIIKDITKPVDVVLVAFPGIADKNFPEIKELVERILKKAKVL